MGWRGSDRSCFYFRSLLFWLRWQQLQLRAKNLEFPPSKSSPRITGRNALWTQGVLTICYCICNKPTACCGEGQGDPTPARLYRCHRQDGKKCTRIWIPLAGSDNEYLLNQRVPVLSSGKDQTPVMSFETYWSRNLNEGQWHWQQTNIQVWWLCDLSLSISFLFSTF